MSELKTLVHFIYCRMIPRIRYITEHYLDVPSRMAAEFLFVTGCIRTLFRSIISFFERLIGYQPFEWIDRLIHLNLFFESAVKIFFFGSITVLYYLHFRSKIPSAPKIHWSLIFIISLFFAVMGARDISSLVNSFKKGKTMTETFMTQSSTGIIYSYYSGVSGRRICLTILKGGMKILGLYDRYMEKRISLEGSRIRKKTRFFPYMCKASRDAAMMIRKGMIRSPEELHYVSLVMEKEAGFDPKSFSEKETLKGLHGVAWVIKNRFLSEKFPQNLYDVVMQRRIKNNRVFWQFECIEKHPELFSYRSRFDDHPLYSDGKLTTRTQSLSYRALIDVFILGEKDPTSGALYYYNPDLVSLNIRHRRITKRINSHLFYR